MNKADLVGLLIVLSSAISFFCGVIVGNAF